MWGWILAAAAAAGAAKAKQDQKEVTRKREMDEVIARNRKELNAQIPDYTPNRSMFQGMLEGVGAVGGMMGGQKMGSNPWGTKGGTGSTVDTRPQGSAATGHPEWFYGGGGGTKHPSMYNNPYQMDRVKYATKDEGIGATGHPEWFSANEAPAQADPNIQDNRAMRDWALRDVGLHGGGMRRQEPGRTYYY